MYGAQDDVSGTVTILEVARGLSEMYKDGWRPRRSIIFASFDSEESGLIGSTNLGEMMMINDMSIDGMVAYLKLCTWCNSFVFFRIVLYCVCCVQFGYDDRR